MHTESMHTESMHTDLADLATPAGWGTTRRQDAVSLAAGTWLVLGVFADGWAHFNVPALESFFTPWHGALYSGLVATVGWFALLARPGWRAGRPMARALPQGYQQGAAGAGLFGLGGLADLAWHQIFGVEAGIDALLSPTHLMLFAGGLLILTSPLRSRWSAGQRGTADRWVATGSVTLAAALAAFALIYTSAFTSPRAVQTVVELPENNPGHQAAELPVVTGLASYLVTTAVLAVPLLVLLRRRSLPTGGASLITAALAGLSVTVVDFPAAATTGAAGAIIGALLADIAVARAIPTEHRWTMPATAAVVIVAVWSGQLIGLALAAGVGWPVELWAGIILLSAAAAGLLGALAAPPQASFGTRTQA